MVSWLAVLAVLIGGQRVLELGLATRNRRWLLARGGREFGAGHYPLFFLLHGGWLVGWISEAVWRGPELSKYWYCWLTVFLFTQGLRYWCIVSLGRFWNTRVLVIPGATRISRGPYRFWRHPNYVAVAGELACVPLIYGAWLTALTATLVNAWLLLKIRIPVEEAAGRQLKNRGLDTGSG